MFKRLENLDKITIHDIHNFVKIDFIFEIEIIDNEPEIPYGFKILKVHSSE